jgi:D-lactate dehydrogenase
LLGENRVLLTAHQAFFTQEAVDGIVNTTIENVKLFKEGKTMYDHPNNFLPIRG